MSFFVLRNPPIKADAVATDYLPVENSPTGEAPRCELCDKYIGLRPLVPPIVVDLEDWGASWADVAFGPSDQLLFSDRLVSAYARADLSGVAKFDPVTLRKRIRHGRPKSTEPPIYHLATIARSNAAIDAVASGLERSDEVVCPACDIGGIISYVHRVVLQPSTWSGEDIFYARGLPGTILTTERFKGLFTFDGNEDRMFVRAEEFRLDFRN